MNQPDAFDANSFFLALEFGVGTLVIFGKPVMRRWFPRFDETWFEGSAFGLATLILMWFAFRNVVRVPSVKNIVVFCIPYVVTALWILVMLRFSSSLQANRSRIEGIDSHLRELGSATFEAITLASETAVNKAGIELCKLETEWIKRESSLRQDIHKEQLRLQQELNSQKEGIGVAFSRHEAEQGLTLARKDEEYKERFRAIEALVQQFTKSSSDRFDGLTKMQKKILGTLWKYQRIHSPGGFSQRWTFAIDSNLPEYPDFLEAIGGLAKLGYVSMNPENHQWCITDPAILLMNSIGEAADKLDFFIY